MVNKDSKSENTNTKKIKFFSDQPIAADKEQDIRFGHLDIVDNLKKIILNCPSPFTIGLFGKWGSGKTTILNALRKKMQDNNKDNIAVVSFDVWKYEGDSLRRTFLKEMAKQLQKNLPKNYELNERLEKSVQKIIEKGKFVYNWKLLLPLFGIIVLISIFLYFKYPQNFGTYLSILFGGVTSFSVLFVWIIQQAIKSETTVFSSERLQDPYEFEEEFRKITKGISPKNLLVIIDNLDRCIHGKAVELLSTIKTFLAKDVDVDENNKCIFLIACDDEAIKTHLKNVYDINQDNSGENSFFSADEFLRKFFNISLRIPDFIDTELQTYTEDLLKEIDIPQFTSPDVSYVITNAFRENPRQIKQFINILLASFYLAKEREDSKPYLIISKGTITDNVAFLAKFLIIRQKFPLEYQKIRGSHLNINEIENIEDEKYIDFLRATKTIIVNDIRPFIYLKQSEEERAIPGVKELELGLIDNKCEIVKEKIDIIKTNPKQIESLNVFLLSLIERNERNNRIIPLFNIISCSLEAVHHHNLNLNKTFYNKIADLLNNDHYLKNELERFKSPLIFNEVLTKCNKEDRKGIVDQYIDILGQEKGDKKEPRISIDYAYILFKELLEHKEWLNQDEREKIRQILTEIYHASFKILSLFSENIEDQKDFISGETISKFVSTFSNDDVENKQNINEKIKFLLRFREIIIPEIAQVIITSLQNLLKNENQKAYREEKENLLNCIGDVFNVLYDQILNIPDKSVLNSFADIIIQGVTALDDWSKKKLFIFICLKIVNMLEGSWHSNINTLIQNFFTNADIDSIKFVFNKLSEEEKKELVTKYSGVFQKRVLQHQPIFNFLYPLAPQDLRIQWMSNLISSQLQRALEKLKELSYKVDDKKIVVETLLRTAGGVAIHEKKNSYDAINQLKCANDAKLRNDFALQIKSLLRNTDKSQQEIGYIAFEGARHFSHSVKRIITREIVEWLRSLQPSDAGQIYAVKSVLINWNILEIPVKKDYVDFVFDKLIKRGINIDNIRLGFEILNDNKVNPKYEEYPTYFDDVFARLESESNDQIKTEIKSGLLKLKPSKTNKKNRNFWDKLERLSNK